MPDHQEPAEGETALDETTEREMVEKTETREVTTKSDDEDDGA